MCIDHNAVSMVPTLLNYIKRNHCLQLQLSFNISELLEFCSPKLVVI